MNHPFERILLATEHTDFDAGAERLAFDVAKRCDVPLLAVLPMVSNAEYEIQAPQLALRSEKEAAAKVADLETLAKNYGVDLDIQVRRGEEPYKEIVAVAVQKKADLVVIRRRGKKSFLSNLLVGEMVSRVVSHAPCSVLMVPRASHMWLQGILVAVESSSSSHVLSLACDIALQCSLPLIIICISDDKAAAEEALSRSLARASQAGVEVSGVVLTGRFLEKILDVAKEKKADLVVVGKSGAAQKVVGLSDVPVLAVHA